MYFMERAQKVQCMRSVYSKETKRSAPKQVASQDRYLNYVTNEVKELLTEDEIKQFEDWLNDREEESKKARQQGTLTVLASRLKMAAHVLDKGARFEDEGVEKDPDEVFAALDELKKALRKAGYKRPQKASKAVKRKDDRQADLIPETASEGS